MSSIATGVHFMFARGMGLLPGQMERGVATASAFANWVFEDAKPNWRRYASDDDIVPEDVILRLGAVDHAEIERIKASIPNEFIGTAADYAVDFVDDGADVSFEASNLLIRGVPVRGRPDLVLRHRSKDHVIIVERKTTRLRRPLDIAETSRGTWRNIEAQLWCYSHLDPWRDAERVTLVGDIWIRQRGALTRAIEPLVWLKDDPEHSSSCRALFKRYRGLHSS